MFDEKDAIRQSVEAVYALTEQLGRGGVLTHEAIRAVLGVDPHEGQWDHVVNKVRKRLQDERGIATWPDITVGYRLLTEAEQLQVPSWRLKRAIRQTRKGRKSVSALPEGGLTLHQRRSRIFMMDLMADTESRLRKDLRTQQEELKPTPTLPRRPQFATN